MAAPAGRAPEALTERLALDALIERAVLLHRLPEHLEDARAPGRIEEHLERLLLGRGVEDQQRSLDGVVSSRAA